MAQNLCASCRVKLKHDVDWNVECAWSRLSNKQRDYLSSRGVSPTKFCGLRAVADAEWMIELDKENDIS